MKPPNSWCPQHVLGLRTTVFSMYDGKEKFHCETLRKKVNIGDLGDFLALKTFTVVAL